MMDSRKCQNGGGQWGKGRVESGILKEDFWDEVEFDTRVCITRMWGSGNEIFSML